MANHEQESKTKKGPTLPGMVDALKEINRDLGKVVEAEKQAETSSPAPKPTPPPSSPKE